MRTIRQILAGLDPWRWTTKDKTHRLSWYRIRVGAVREDFTNGADIFIATHIVRCKFGGATKYTGQSKSLEEAKEMAKRCPVCRDTPCEEYAEPTEEADP